MASQSTKTTMMDCRAHEKPPATESRVYYMDSLRAVLMAIGIAYHAAYVYDSSRHWIVSDPSGSPAYSIFIDLLHLFRMPVFFVIAGFFTYSAFKKYSGAQFIRIRCARVGIPFLATLMSVNLLQSWYLAEKGLWHFSIDYWVGHLWFLANLCIYIVLFFLAMNKKDLLQRPIAFLEQICNSRLNWPGLYVAFIGTIALIRLTIKPFNLWSTQVLGFIDVWEFLYYLIFFIAGLILFRSRAIYDQVTRPGKLLPLVAIALTMGFVGIKHVVSLSILLGPLATLIQMSAVFFGSILILRIFKQYFNVDSPVARFFSDASYSMYLFHPPVIIVFATLLLPFQLLAFEKYLLLVFITVGITLALHFFVISRVPLLKTLFNGKLTARKIAAVEGSTLYGHHSRVVVQKA